MATEKQRSLILDVLTRGLANTSPYIVEKLREDATRNEAIDHIANNIVRELSQDRWQMKGPPRTDNCTLEGFLRSALRASHCPHLASDNPDQRRRASMEAVDRICATLRDSRVVLIQWRKR